MSTFKTGSGHILLAAFVNLIGVSKVNVATEDPRKSRGGLGRQ